MAQTRIGGGGIWIPAVPAKDINQTPILSSFLTLDSSDKKLAMVGSVFTVNRSSKSITRLGFRLGLVNTASTSQWILSLQNVSTSAGPPGRPDGTQDQTVTISSTDATLVSSGWYRTQPLSANRSVAFGELLAVVWEFSTAGQLGTDSLVVSNLRLGNLQDLNSGTLIQNGGTWDVQIDVPTILLEFSDGTYGTLEKSLGPFSGLVTNDAYNSGTSSGSGGNERGMRFSLPFDCSVDGCSIDMLPAGGTSFDVILYAGTTVLQSVSIDTNIFATAGVYFPGTLPFPAEQSITSGTEYILAVKPSTAVNVTLPIRSVSTNPHFSADHNSTAFYYATRTGSAAWDFDDTKRPFGMSLRISKLEAGGEVTQASESNLSQVMFRSRGVAY